MKQKNRVKNRKPARIRLLSPANTAANQCPIPYIVPPEIQLAAAESAKVQSPHYVFFSTSHINTGLGSTALRFSVAARLMAGLNINDTNF